MIIECLSWKQCHTHAYQVSSPCVLPLASLRSEEVNAWLFVVVLIILGRHGNDEIHMHTNLISMHATVNKFED